MHFCCPTRTNRGHTGGGKHRGFFFFLCFFFAPPSSCGACLYFLSREGFGCPCPSSTPKLNFVYSRSFSAINRFPLPGTKVRKKPTLAEIRTRDLVARRLRGYQLDHRGDRLQCGRKNITTGPCSLAAIRRLWSKRTPSERSPFTICCSSRAGVATIPAEDLRVVANVRNSSPFLIRRSGFGSFGAHQIVYSP